MKSNHTTIFFIITIGLLAISCYKLKEENFNTVGQPRTNVAVQTNISGDTIDVYDITEINYVIDIVSESVEGVTVSIDGKVISSEFSTKTVSFEIDPGDFGTGYYTMQIDIYLKTGTGSLADKTGGEFIVVSDKKIIHIDIDAPTNEMNAEFVIEDGRSIIRWDKPNKPNILAYKVLIRASYWKATWDTISTNNVIATEYHDKGFPGGELTYKVLWEGYDYLVESQEIKVSEKTIEDLKYVIDAQDHVIISAENYRLYNNSVKMTFNSRNRTQYFDSFGSSTIITDDYPLYFGEARRCPVRMNSTLDSDHSHQYLDTLEIYLGNRIKPFVKSYFFMKKNVILLIGLYSKYTKKYPIIYKYNFQTMELLNTVYLEFNNVDFLCSGNGDHVYMFHDSKVDKLDIDNMEVSFYANESDLLAGNTGNSLGSLSNDNLISFQNDSKWYVVDATSHNILFEKTIEYPSSYHNERHSYVPILSDDGNYIYIQEKQNVESDYFAGSIYEKQGDTYVKKMAVGQLLYTPTVHFISDQSGTKIIGTRYFDREYYTYNIDGAYATLVSTSPAIDLRRIKYYDIYDDIDVISRSLFGLSDNNELIIYDIDTWTIKSSTKASSNVGFDFIDTKLLSQDGLWIEPI